MADQTNNRTAGTAGMSFILGGLVVAVGFIAYFMFTEADVSDPNDINISIDGGGSGLENAAQAVENTMSGN